MKASDSNSNNEKPAPGKATPVVVEVVHPSGALVVTLKQAKEEIAKLHQDAMGSSRLTLEKALYIGQKLAEVKEIVGRGRWEKWVDTNLEFDVRTAQNYMRLHKNRAEVLAKYETVSHLGVTDAYRLLVRFSKKPEVSESVPEADRAAESGEIQTRAGSVTEETTAEDSQDNCSAQYSSQGDEELLVGTFTPQQAEEILELMRRLGINQEAYQVLRAQGEIRKLKPTLRTKLTPYLCPAGSEEQEEHS